MKWILAAALAIGAAAPAFACNSEMLLVKDWQAITNEGNRLNPVGLTATVQYQGPKPYRMIHAGVMLADVLGKNVGQVNLGRDQEVAPGETVEADGLVDAKERLLTMNRDDVVTRTCVWSIVYEDGTVEKFD